MPLTLTRRELQSVEIIIPPSTEARIVTVQYVRHVGAHGAKLAFTAPDEIQVLRTELMPVAKPAERAIA